MLWETIVELGVGVFTMLAAVLAIWKLRKKKSGSRKILQDLGERSDC